MASNMNFCDFLCISINRQSADIWFSGTEYVVRKNFLRLKPNLQNSKISYFIRTSKIFYASANFTIRHVVHNKLSRKIVCISHWLICKKHKPRLRHEFFSSINIRLSIGSFPKIRLNHFLIFPFKLNC
jgi:hypothetical protein